MSAQAETKKAAEEKEKRNSLSGESIKQKKVEVLEDEDEFEDFPMVDTKAQKKGTELDQELNVWTDNWDDENIEKDFCAMLREELSKNGNAPNPL